MHSEMLIHYKYSGYLMKEIVLKLLVIFILLLSLMAEVHGQTTADEWQLKAIELAAGGNIEAAKIAFDEAIRLSPNDPFIPHIAGITIAAKGITKRQSITSMKLLR